MKYGTVTVPCFCPVYNVDLGDVIRPRAEFELTLLGVPREVTDFKRAGGLEDVFHVPVHSTIGIYYSGVQLLDVLSLAAHTEIYQNNDNDDNNSDDDEDDDDIMRLYELFISCN